MALQTEFDFVLPQGFVDREGTLHREGTMRLATAMDEIAPLRDPRVRENQAYLVILLLSRVVTRLGTLPAVSPFRSRTVQRRPFLLAAAVPPGERTGHITGAGDVPGVFDADRRGHFAPGGILGYPLDRIQEEVAYLAYYLHWPPDRLLDMEHGDRRMWVGQVADIHRRAATAAGS